MKKKILVSGGTGFIGYHIVKKCIALKWSVAILSSRKPNKLRYIKNVEYIRCNVTKKKDIQKKLRKNYDYVVNLAGYVNHVEKKKTFSSHYNGSKNLADHFKKKKLNHLYKLVVERNMVI